MSARAWKARTALRSARWCLCEYTPRGWFAYPCHRHSCVACGHPRHDAENGCGAPDPWTGWCDCLADAMTGSRLQIARKRRVAKTIRRTRRRSQP